MEYPNKSELSDEECVVPTGLGTFYPSQPGIAMPGFHIPPLRGCISDRGGLPLYPTPHPLYRRLVVTETFYCARAAFAFGEARAALASLMPA